MNRYLADGYSDKLSACIEKIDAIKELFAQKGFAIQPSEPLKITVNAAASGFTGDELADILRYHNIECEFVDDTFLVLMISPENREIDFERLKKAFSEITPKPPLRQNTNNFILENNEQVMSIREAIFAECENVSVEKSVGRICGTPTVSCPPAIPIVVSGERISENAVQLFKRYGIDEISVVKE